MAWLLTLLALPLSALENPVLTQSFAGTEPYFEMVGDQEAIPYGVIVSLAQDRQGLLWIGTQVGLVRYDGYRFRKFVHDARDSASLPGNFIRALWAAADGRLWIGTLNDGLSVYDPRTESFENFSNDPAQVDSLSSGTVWALAGDSKGGLWVATSSGLDYLPAASRKFVHYRHKPEQADSLIDEQVHSLLLDSQARLWVGTAKGLQRLNPDGKTFETIASDPSDAASLSGQDITALFEARDGKLWLGTQAQGAAWLAPGTRQLHRIKLGTGQSDKKNQRWITSIAQVSVQQIWLGSYGGGMKIVDAQDARPLQQLYHDPSIPSSLALDTVGALLADRSGLLWVGSWGAGLQKYNATNLAFQTLRHSPVRASGLSHPDIHSVLEAKDGQLLIGTEANGIDIFDRQGGLSGAHRPKHAQPVGLSDGTILSMAHTSDGSLWVGTRHDGVQRLARGSTHWQKYAAGQGLPGNLVRKLLVTQDGNLWAATDAGLARWHAQQQGFVALRKADGSPIRAAVRALVEDRQGRVWAGSDSGLWLHEPGSDYLRNFRRDMHDASSLSSDDVNGLLIDRRGRLWADTAQGLDRLVDRDVTLASFEHISTQLGRPGLYFGANLLEDKLGRIWTQWFVYDPQKEKVIELSKADGIDIGTPWINAYTKTADGLFLFGGTQGLAIIQPESFQAWNYQPQVVPTGLQIDGKAVPLGALTPTLHLSSEQRGFAIEFAALDYSAPQKNRYSYRLHGYDKDWVETDAGNRSANYSNLWPGNYHLQVRGSNRLGEWSPHEVSIAVSIAPAFWQTGWFLALSLFSLGGSGYLAYRWRLARLRAKAKALQSLLQARSADILKLGEIGQELTTTLDTEQAFERVYKQVSARLDAHVFSIGIYDENAAVLQCAYAVVAGQRQVPFIISMDESERPAVWCVRQQKELITSTHAGLLDYVASIAPLEAGERMQSMVYLPLFVEHQVIGCLSVQSPRPFAYHQDQLEFLRVLASYTAIAVSNSTAHGQLATAHRHLQESQQQLALQEKMAGLGTLTAGIAHEINNPTNFAHVAAQNLQVEIGEFKNFIADLVEADEAPEVLQAFADRFSKLSAHVTTMLNGTERIKAIVKDLRVFTRLDHSEKDILRLSECLTSTLNLVRTGWQEKVEFETEFVDDPEIECWPALLNQVFMNLLVNGCQAIAEKQLQSASQIPGHLQVRMSCKDGAVVISFADDGIGIPAEIQAHIMEPFYTTKEVGAGTGLGLSIVYGIVEKHGGTLSFTSTPGMGSCFNLHLPAAGAVGPHGLVAGGVAG